MVMSAEKIRAQIAQLEEQRNEYVNEVNRNIAFINGKIEALKSFLPVPPEEETVSE